MKTVIFAYSRQGMRTGEKAAHCFADDSILCFAPEHLAAGLFHPIEKPTVAFYGKNFREAELLIFVGACGIAVRAIAPHIRSKQTDPAVLCVDERGQYVIPILSGHIGGANAAARKLAAHLGALLVITTATDINGRFSVDEWTARQGWIIDDMEKAKKVSAAILERDVPLCSDLPIGTALPAGLCEGDSGELGICIGWQKTQPFRETLRLIPSVLHLGVGCRRGTAADTVERVIRTVLDANKIDPRAIKSAASIDLKRDEEGLLTCFSKMGIPLNFYVWRMIYV